MGKELFYALVLFSFSISLMPRDKYLKCKKHQKWVQTNVLMSESDDVRIAWFALSQKSAVEKGNNSWIYATE